MVLFSLTMTIASDKSQIFIAPDFHPAYLIMEDTCLGLPEAAWRFFCLPNQKSQQNTRNSLPTSQQLLYGAKKITSRIGCNARNNNKQTEFLKFGEICGQSQFLTLKSDYKNFTILGIF